MKNIFKQSGELDTNSKENNFKNAVIRLTVYYSIGVFFMLFVSSFFIYGLFSQSILEEEQERDESGYEEIFERELEFHDEAKENLFNIILLSNILLSIVTVFVAYILSKKTLAPLEISYKKQKRFVADAAHELRTPLAVLKAGSEVLLQKERSIGEYKKSVEESLEEINRLIVLSNDLLFLAQSNDSHIKTNVKFSLSQVCQKNIDQICAYAETKKVTIKSTIEPNVSISGRPDDMARLILNLTKNAIDYNVLNGSVTVSLKIEKEYAVLNIEDTGVGIDSKDIPHIFERFYKADISRSYTGSLGAGLGLSIIKEIVDQHKGTIHVESSLGKGTKISIQLPCL